MTIFLLLLVAVLLAGTMGLSPHARLMPLVALLPAAAAILIQLALEASTRLSETQTREPAEQPRAREHLAFAVVGGVTVAVFLIGTVPAIAAFVFLWLSTIARTGIAAAFLWAAAAWVAVDQGLAKLGIILPQSLLGPVFRALLG